MVGKQSESTLTGVQLGFSETGGKQLHHSRSDPVHPPPRIYYEFEIEVILVTFWPIFNPVQTLVSFTISCIY